MSESPSFGLVFSFFDERYALPGLLENAAPYFDDIVAFSAPPEGETATEEDIGLLEKWGVRIVHDTIEEGFGPLRTRMITAPDTEWTWISDCDERHFCPLVLGCEGTESWDMTPDHRPAIKAVKHGLYDQFGMVKQILGENPAADAVLAVRRHWFDWTYCNPTQNWAAVTPDWQCRILRNTESTSFRGGMHEGCYSQKTGTMPTHLKMDPADPKGVFFDHFHIPIKSFEAENRQLDIRTYDRLHQKFDV